MPIAWVHFQPLKMFVDSSEVSAAATMQLLLFRRLFLSRKHCHLPKTQRKNSVNSKENLQRHLTLLVKKEHESSSLSFLWETNCIGYFPISCWDNDKINKKQECLWPISRNKSCQAQLCSWTHTVSSIIYHGGFTVVTGLPGWGLSKVFHLR